MRPFAYHSADSIEAAIRIAGTVEGSSRWLAGGTDLLGVLKDDILVDYPSALINLKSIPGLNEIDPEGDPIRIGALAKLTAIMHHPSLRQRLPALCEAAKTVATPEIRNMATLGGNLCQDTRCWYYRYPHHMGKRMVCPRKGEGPCHAVRGDNRYHAVVGGKKCFAPGPSDTAVVLAALDASLSVATADGAREISVHQFYTPMGHVLGPQEILTEVRVPAPPAGSKQGFLKYTVRKPVDFAVVSVAAVVAREDKVCRDVRIALGGVAPGPLRASEAEQSLVGKRLGGAAVAEAAQLVLANAKPLSGNGYKIDIARSLVRDLLNTLA